MRLIDADRFEVYVINGSTYKGDSFFAYMDGIQKVLEDIDAAPTIDPNNIITGQQASAKNRLLFLGKKVLTKVSYWVHLPGAPKNETKKQEDDLL